MFFGNCERRNGREYVALLSDICNPWSALRPTGSSAGRGNHSREKIRPIQESTKSCKKRSFEDPLRGCHIPHKVRFRSRCCQRSTVPPRVFPEGSLFGVLMIRRNGWWPGVRRPGPQELFHSISCSQREASTAALSAEVCRQPYGTAQSAPGRIGD